MRSTLHSLQIFVNHLNEDEAVRRFVERFGLLLADAGMPRTAARAFACVLAEDSGRLTAGELTERLGVSPAAISGAVRYLTQAGLLIRGREPGERRDHYAVHEDVWSDMYLQRMQLLEQWDRALADAVELLAPDRAAARRLTQTREFFAFLHGEVPGIIDRWRAYKDARGL
jgi:DNA-binding transcriptional regulator GbsR (MarR family)